jgi:hypothetical protein
MAVPDILMQCRRSREQAKCFLQKLFEAMRRVPRGAGQRQTKELRRRQGANQSEVAIRKVALLDRGRSCVGHWGERSSGRRLRAFTCSTG